MLSRKLSTEQTHWQVDRSSKWTNELECLNTACDGVAPETRSSLANLRLAESLAEARQSLAISFDFFGECASREFRGVDSLSRDMTS